MAILWSRYLLTGLVVVAIVIKSLLGIPIEQVEKRDIVEDGCGSCEPGYQCCLDSNRCNLNECERCWDGLYSPGGTASCQNCAICIAGQTIINECTIYTDTKCSNCSDGSYLSSAKICQPCSRCNGDLVCKDICATEAPPPPVIGTVNPGHSSVSSVQSTVKPTDMTAKEVKKTTVRERSKAPTATTQNTSIWTHLYLIPFFIVPVICLLIVLSAKRALCCWTQRSKEFWKNNCPCCGNNYTGVPTTGDSNGITMEDRTSNTNTNTDNTPVTAVSASNAQDEGGASENSEEKTVKKFSTNLQPEVKMRRRNSLRLNFSKANLDQVPEEEPILIESNQNYALADWCLRDNTRVTMENISEISTHIGSVGINIGGLLGLETGEIEVIEHDHRSDLSRQNLEILKLWISKQGMKATKKCLATALLRVGRPQVAEYLWLDREFATPPASPQESTFWQRRKSTESQFKFDSYAFNNMNWEIQTTWKDIMKDIQAKDFGDYKQFALACGTVEANMPQLYVKKCPNYPPDMAIDETASSLLKIMQLKNRIPVCVPEGNDCLFAAASVIGYGSPDHCPELRLRTVIELCYHKDYYLEQSELVECIKAEYALNKMSDDDTLKDPVAIESNFVGSVRDTLKESSLFSLQGNSVQLFGLASVLGCNIQSVYPVEDSTESALNVLIKSRDKTIKKPPTVFIMWSMREKVSDGTFLPNHFVPLLEK